MREAPTATYFIARHHVQRQRVVRDGLLRQNETFRRQRSASTRDWRKERDGARHVRPDDVSGSLYSSCSPLVRAGKYPVEHDLKHNDDRAAVFQHQIDGGDEAR